MAKTSKAQLAANRRYDARNRDKTRYDTGKRNARGFINPKKGTAMYEAVNGYGAPFYLDDLRDFEIEIQKRIKELEK